MRPFADRSLSVIVPLYNEAENVVPLHAELSAVLDGLGRPCELIFVDDGSTDDGPARLRRLACEDGRTTVVRLRRNSGQSAALAAGLAAAGGRTIVTLDGDGQNDPADIPRLLAALDEGADFAHGWRRRRHDPWLTRRLPSQAANWLIRQVLDAPVHDLGCGIKAFRGELAPELDLWGEMHRYLPVLAQARGARCREVEVAHRPRVRGRSKYGLGRTPRVLLDLGTVLLLTRFHGQPMRLLGGAGMLAAAAGGLCGLGALACGLAGAAVAGWALAAALVLLWLSAIHLVGLGLVAESVHRGWAAATGRTPFAVREIWRKPAEADDAGGRIGRMGDSLSAAKPDAVRTALFL